MVPVLGTCSSLHAQLAVDSIVWASEASQGAVAWMGQVAQQASSWPLQPPRPLSAPLQVQDSENLSLSLARERAPSSVIIKLH